MRTQPISRVRGIRHHDPILTSNFLSGVNASSSQSKGRFLRAYFSERRSFAPEPCAIIVQSAKRTFSWGGVPSFSLPRQSTNGSRQVNTSGNFDRDASRHRVSIMPDLPGPGMTHPAICAPSSVGTQVPGSGGSQENDAVIDPLTDAHALSKSASASRVTSTCEYSPRRNPGRTLSVDRYDRNLLSPP